MNYALITGGSRGIGRAVCVELAAKGYPVLVNFAANETAALETKQIIEDRGGCAELLPFDVSDGASVDDALEMWTKCHPEDFVGLLVNNAGIRKDALMVFMADKQWSDVVDVSLNGFFNVTRRVLLGMMKQRGGRIINVVSLSGLKGLPGQTNYSAAKAAVIGATKALAQEVAARNVTVNAVAPGFIATDMTMDLDEESLKKTIPVGRFGKPEEVAALVSFLASDAAAYITGEVISINGGLY
jgi:3-oxoacyl-[acyl-carrier protein] reductase